MNTMTWLYLPTAFLVGMAHAVEPGHGKTIVATCLLGSKGTVKDAILLGLTVTFAHTIVIFLLAAGALALGAAFPIATVQRWLEIVSASLVAIMGLWLLRSRIGEWRREREYQHMHDHDHHDHGHSHDLPSGNLSFKQLFSFGLSGGLVPCPAALALFILAVGLGKPVLGVVTVAVFSLGLALTLMGIGIAVCRGYTMFEKRAGNSYWLNTLPIVSSSIVTLLGLAMLIRVLFGQGHPSPHAEQDIGS